MTLAVGFRLGPYEILAPTRKFGHFGQVKGDTIAQVHGIGPFKVIYVNPADDPAAKSSKK